jgi:hypothetical protein
MYSRQVEIESSLGSYYNQLGYLSCNLDPLNIKGGVEVPLGEQIPNFHHHINCHEQYKNTRRMTITLWEA